MLTASTIGNPAWLPATRDQGGPISTWKLSRRPSSLPITNQKATIDTHRSHAVPEPTGQSTRAPVALHPVAMVYRYCKSCALVDGWTLRELSFPTLPRRLAVGLSVPRAARDARMTGKRPCLTGYSTAVRWKRRTAPATMPWTYT